MRLNSHDLDTKPPAEWKRDVMRLPEAHRWQVASVIWWDFFSQRMTGERWGDLDHIVNARVNRVEISDADLLRGLEACGYSVMGAQNRVNSKGRLKRYAHARAEAVAAMRAGEHIDSVGERLGVNEHTMWGWARCAGLATGRRKPIPPAKRRKIVEMLAAGKTPAVVAKALSLDPSTVSKIGRKAGLYFGAGRPFKAEVHHKGTKDTEKKQEAANGGIKNER